MIVDALHGGKKHGHSHDDVIPKKTKKSTRESVDKQLQKGVSDGPPCCSSDPVKQLNDVQRMASVIEHEIEGAAKEATGETPNDDERPTIEKKESLEDVDEENVQIVTEDKAETERLHKMGLSTAIAIGLHNFPEGECESNSWFEWILIDAFW